MSGKADERSAVQHHCPQCGIWYDCELGEDCTLLGVVNLVCAECDPEHHTLKGHVNEH